MSAILSIKQLSKSFGFIRAVNELSFEVNKGDIFGLLGPNGSGKTTTLGIVLGVISPESGTYSWFGTPPGSKTRKKIGAILETPQFYPYLSGVKNLKILADIKECKYDDIDRVLKIVDLHDRKNHHYRNYSLGMKQRLGIAGALLCEPEVLILDEPTNGLDPQGIADIRKLILRIAEDGTTIILASHLLDEVQKTCSHVTILDHGKNMYSGNVDAILNETPLIEVSSDDLEKLFNALSNYTKIKSIYQEADKVIIMLDEDSNSADINEYLFSNGVTVNHLCNRKKTLEKHFLQILAQSND
ncbi:MAG: ATP-binding cassette domain-containing protein [Bacteroidales bacterium]|nr:ATP-binding cassette domain-containing protein [Bacteroidales bacterium]